MAFMEDPDQILTIYLCFWLVLAGGVMGSFLDCAAWRYVRGGQMFRGRSHCASCGHILTARDLVPVFSFLFARGRCRHCKEKIPAECLWAEIFCAAAYVCLGIHFGPVLELAQWLILATLLLAISLVDASTKRIPGQLLVAMAVSRVCFVPFLSMPVKDALPAAAISLGAIVIPLLLLTLLVERVIGREAMGGGDIKLLMAMALYLDWKQLLLTLLLGCILGIIGAFAARLKGTFPFGPYLAASCILSVCFGAPLIAWYTGLF